MAVVLQASQELTHSTVEVAKQCIEHDGVLALATESSYALAAGVEQHRAIERIVRLKGDRKGQPILLLVGSKSQVRSVTSTISPVAELLMDSLWPGPLTLILPANSTLSEHLTGGTETIGVRLSGYDHLCQLLAVTGPLTGTSANRSGMSPALTSQEVEEAFGDELDLILDSGPAPGGLPSTVLNLVDEIRIKRQGPISLDVIQNVLTPLNLKVQVSLL